MGVTNIVRLYVSHCDGVIFGCMISYGMNSMSISILQELPMLLVSSRRINLHTTPEEAFLALGDCTTLNHMTLTPVSPGHLGSERIKAQSDLSGGCATAT